MNFKLIANKLYILFPLLVFASLLYVSGCDDSGTVNPPPVTTDSNVIVYKGVAAFYWQTGTNDTSYMGVDLLEGDSVRQISVKKDMELIDSVNTFHNFYFRSGDLSLLVIGLKTRFNRIYADMQSTQFDTLSVIPDSDTLLTPADFTADDTYGNSAWGYFNFGQTTKPVYSFYLQGRNLTGTNYIYGVFHVRTIESVTSQPPNASPGILVTIDIKLNKAGHNHFKP